MRKGKLFARAAVAAAVVLGTVLTIPSPAQAVTVRPGAQDFQIDVMLDDYETEQARHAGVLNFKLYFFLRDAIF